MVCDTSDDVTTFSELPFFAAVGSGFLVTFSIDDTLLGSVCVQQVSTQVDL